MTKKSKTYPAQATNPVAKIQKSVDNPVAHQVVHQTIQHSGPLPDPASLERYNRIVPDAAERIIKMAELNSEHFRKMETLAINAQIEDGEQQHREVRRGQYAGFLSVVIAFSAATYALHLGYTGVAGTICSVTVGGLVTVFVTGRKAQGEKKPSEAPPNEGR